VDAIVVGRGTAEVDDPLLTARPPGPRTAARIVLDSQASLVLDRKLVHTARQVPLIVAVASVALSAARDALSAAGCEVLVCPGDNHAQRLAWLLDELGRRKMTNVLVEGGSQLLGELFDAGQVDEVHAFIAPKIAGGRKAPSPAGGAGVDLMAKALHLAEPVIEQSGSDVYIRGRIVRA
jgi:diaminohydroxyphosphoribosylaminopyrimidine deaminase/5-amino-6-(5-phosphoribosylamino)uracil reductase